MSYREAVAVMTGRSRYMQFEIDVAMRAAWHVAAFDRMKRIPRLDKVLNPKTQLPSQPQTGEQQYRAAMSWLNTMKGRGLKVKRRESLNG